MSQTKTITLKSYEHFGRRAPAQAFGEILKSIPEAVQQSVRMAVEGRSRAKGKRPDWLRAAADIRFVGHEGDHETLVHFEAPSFGEAAPQLYAQHELWPTKPARDDTGFDILGDVLREITAENADSERFDRHLLDQIAGFDRALNGTFSEMAIPGRRQHRKGLAVVTPAVAEIARTLGAHTPSPRRVRIIGKLDRLRASTQSFGIVLRDRQEVRGVLTTGSISDITPFLDQQVLVLGAAVYRPSGKLLRIDAEEVTLSSGETDFFSAVPKGVSKKFDVRETMREQQHKTGIAAVIGKWPGDETDEEIDTALRELS